LNIDGTLYNVTFGTTDSNPAPFDTNGDAGDAASDIASALGTYGIVSSATFAGGGEQYYCVDQGGGVCTLSFEPTISTYGWFYVGSSNTITGIYSYIPFGGIFFTEFSPAVATPEPGDFMLTLTGVVLLGLMVVMRKRVANRHPQAT
jgi:hypothetical protein